MKGVQEKEPVMGVRDGCEGQIEKFVPCDYSLPSLGKPSDTRQRSSGRMFPFSPPPHPHTSLILITYTVNQ